MSAHDVHPDFETLIRNARMQRSMAVGNAIASVVGALSRAISRAIAALFPPSDRHGNDAASAHH